MGIQASADFEIHTISDTGTGLVQMTVANTDLDEAPSWSPDGTKFVFASDRNGGSEIWVMNADKTGEAQLTDTAGVSIDKYPCWSPDGTQIVFASNRDGGTGGNGDYEIWVMDADGTNLVQLTDTGAFDDTLPSW